MSDSDSDSSFSKTFEDVPMSTPEEEEQEPAPSYFQMMCNAIPRPQLPCSESPPDELIYTLDTEEEDPEFGFTLIKPWANWTCRGWKRYWEENPHPCHREADRSHCDGFRAFCRELAGLVNCVENNHLTDAKKVIAGHIRLEGADALPATNPRNWHNLVDDWWAHRDFFALGHPEMTVRLTICKYAQIHVANRPLEACLEAEVERLFQEGEGHPNAELLGQGLAGGVTDLEANAWLGIGESILPGPAEGKGLRLTASQALWLQAYAPLRSVRAYCLESLGQVPLELLKPLVWPLTLASTTVNSQKLMKQVLANVVQIGSQPLPSELWDMKTEEFYGFNPLEFRSYEYLWAWVLHCEMLSEVSSPRNDEAAGIDRRLMKKIISDAEKLAAFSGEKEEIERKNRRKRTTKNLQMDRPIHLIRGLCLDNYARKDTQIFRSNTKPVSVTFEGVTASGKPATRKVIVKNENLIQDKIIWCCIEYARRVLAQHSREWGSSLLNYEVLVAGTERGMIQRLRGKTFEALGGRTLVDYIADEEQRDEKAFALILNSTALWSVISWLLGLRDRHQGNLMLDGPRMFHIDWGWVLGKEPNGVPKGFGELRVIPGFFDLVNGRGKWGEFQQTGIQAFHVLRAHHRVFHFLLRRLPQFMKGYTHREVDLWVADHFKPGSSPPDAQRRLEKLLEPEHYDSYALAASTKIGDGLHSAAAVVPATCGSIVSTVKRAGKGAMRIAKAPGPEPQPAAVEQSLIETTFSHDWRPALPAPDSSARPTTPHPPGIPALKLDRLGGGEAAGPPKSVPVPPPTTTPTPAPRPTSAPSGPPRVPEGGRREEEEEDTGFDTCTDSESEGEGEGEGEGDTGSDAHSSDSD